MSSSDLESTLQANSSAKVTAEAGGWLSTARQRVAANPISVAAIMAFALNLFIVSANLFPNLLEINAWDEAVNVNSGRLLLEGQWPVFAGNPLVALFYALTYLPYQESPFWLVQSISLGRIILFALLWLGAFAVAKQLEDLAHPLIMVGMLFVSIIPVSLLVFPSDPLFVAMAALALAFALAFLKGGGLKELALASLFLGLAALARNDGFVLGIGLIFAAPILAKPPPHRWKAAVAVAVPFAVLVAGYVLFFGVLTGRFELGTAGRTYDNFEAGQQVIYSGEGQLNPVLEAKLEARRVFGTAEENRNSVFVAILRNPSAYLERLAALVPRLPSNVLSAYGVRAAVPMLLLAARGVWELVRLRRLRMLTLLLIWLIPLLSGFIITLFRIGHIRFSFYVVFALAAIGLMAALGNIKNRREHAFWLLSLLVFTGYGLVDVKPAVVYGAFVALAAFAFSYQVRRWWPTLARPLAVPALIFLAAGILLHGDYPGFKIRVLGEAADEQAVQFMVDNFDPGTPVAAGAPGPIYTARMTYMGLTSLDVPRTDTAADFLDWMKGQGIVAIYVDASLYRDNPFYWNQISSLIGEGLERVFVAEEGNYQVLEIVD